MIANLYLHSEAFRYNGTDTEEMVAGKIKSLLNDIVDIVYDSSGENVFKTSNDLINNCKVYEKEGMMDFLQKHLNVDEITLFYTMLCNISDDYNLSYEELEKLCEYKKEEKEVNSILVINRPKDEDPDKKIKPYMEFDKYMVVYSKDSWITLRRQILGNHPNKPEDYIREAKKYFPKIVFHDNCIESLKQDNYLETIPRKLTLYLACLNDKFYIIRKKYKPESDRNDILSGFSGECRFDEPASLEGNIKKKMDMIFYFKDEKNKEFKVCCEPHLKISQEDKNYTRHINYDKFHPRIYFAFDVKENEDIIFVGSIGPHL